MTVEQELEEFKDGSELANTILKNILRLDATPERLGKLEWCIENLLNDELITEQQVYEQNCSIARLFIEEHLGLDPTPKRIQAMVCFIQDLEGDANEKRL